MKNIHKILIVLYVVSLILFICVFAIWLPVNRYMYQYHKVDGILSTTYYHVLDWCRDVDILSYA